MDWFTVKVGTFYVLNKLFGKKRPPAVWKRLGGIGETVVSPACDSVRLCAERGEIEIRALSPLVFRVIVRRKADPEYFSASALDIPSKGLRVTNEDGYLKITTENEENSLTAEVSIANSTVRFSHNGRLLHSEPAGAVDSGKWVSCAKRHEEDELIIGMGQKATDMFKNGRNLVMWNTDDPRLSKNSDPLYQSCPFEINMRVSDGSSHALFYDNPNYSVFRCGGKKGSVTSYFARGGPLCYYVLGGPTLKLVCAQLAMLTGRYSLPPLWVFGHHHSRWENSESALRLLGIARETREHGVPCDALHIDIGHMEGFRCFTWSKERFPDPKGFIEKLHEMGFKVVVIADPGIKSDESWSVYNEGKKRGFFCADKKGRIYIADVWPGKSAFVDFTSPAAREWWGSLFSEYVDYGIDGFWNDMNEPSLFNATRTMPSHILHRGGNGIPPVSHAGAHNIYGLLMTRATSEGLGRLKPESRQFVFTRSSFTGIQRYGSSWTGDNRSDWIHLKLSIPMIINMGLSGQPMTGPDIGGFWGNTNPELLTRWMEAGVLYPFSRNHTASGTAFQEIWLFGLDVEEICKSYICLRYSLLPYIYAGMRESCETGIPFMRPLFLDFPNDPGCRESVNCETEFLAGPAFLVAPVLEPGVGSRSVYFPQGADWIDYFTGERYRGGESRTVSAPLSKLPIYVRQGSAIPVSDGCTTVPDSLAKRLSIRVYPSRAIDGYIYADDGETTAYKNGAFSLVRIKGEATKEEARFSINRVEGSLEPELHKYEGVKIMICKQSLASEITDARVNGKSIAFTIEKSREGCEWITLEDQPPSLAMEVSIKLRRE